MAVRQLGKPLHEQPPWHIWLDLMRKSKRGFRTTRVVPFRVFKAAIEGRGLSDTSAFRIVGGSIHHVFQVSAEFCEDLAFGMPEGVPTLAADSGSPKAKHTGTTEPGGDESTCAEAGPAQQEKTGIAKQNGVKKRGRPQTIPDEKKEAALKKKNDGGTNRDAAKILYATTYPTDQQVKNVTSILENYKKRQSASRIAVPDPLLNPQKPNKSRV